MRRTGSTSTPATSSPATRTARGRSIPGPSLRLARGLMRTHGHVVVAGMDEVGRGALAGPVTVGVVAVHAATPSAPAGLHDSKLLTAAQRERLEPRLQRWAPSWSLGHASNDEIDRWGILLALRVAGLRALAGLSLAPDRVVLDGSYDWLRRPVPAPRQGSLLDGPDESPEIVLPALPPREECLPVDLVVKADQRCSAVAAASVLAKVGRDRLMVELAADDPRWGWAGNKGYSAPEHLQALWLHCPGHLHRRSWRLPARP